MSQYWDQIQTTPMRENESLGIDLQRSFFVEEMRKIGKSVPNVYEVWAKSYWSGFRDFFFKHDAYNCGKYLELCPESGG
jgi:hypothetical protein